METENPSNTETSQQIDQNIEKVLAFYQREDSKLGPLQRTVELASNYIGRPMFLALLVLFIFSWLFFNIDGPRFGWHAFDPPPFVYLQGLVTLSSLLTTTIVLISQNRIAKVEEQRANLELQVNLLSEQKIAKLINLVEELRRDLPMVQNRHDSKAEAFQQPADTDQVLSALDERRTEENMHESSTLFEVKKGSP
ncbi:MAG: DUF1003 domain-containing protein [Burkholderiales bacterium]